MSSDKEQPEDQREGHLWLNIGKALFLLAMLAIAWFVLEWLIGFLPK